MSLAVENLALDIKREDDKVSNRNLLRQDLIKESKTRKDKTRKDKTRQTGEYGYNFHISNAKKSNYDVKKE